MICRYCGIETGSGGGHPSQAECIKALHDEIDRAKQMVDRAKQMIDRARDDHRPTRTPVEYAGQDRTSRR